MTVLFPEDIGITCPKELEYMYADNAASPGDGDPVVTAYPQYPMSAWELWNYQKGKVAQHCNDLQTKYPSYFNSHAKFALQNFIRGLK
jgi:hypothetical protein